MIHYYETAEERSVRHENYCCTPCALCGNGQPPTRLKTTRDPTQVTCEKCKQLLVQRRILVQKESNL